MPTVPYQSVPTVQPLPMPRLRREPQLPPNAPSEAFGGGVASQAGGLGDLSAVGDVAQRIAEQQQRIRLEEKAKADQVAVTEAGADIATHSNKLWSQYQNELGKTSFDLPERASNDFWTVQSVIENNLANDEQRAAVHKIGLSEWTQLNDRVQNHVAQQRKVYDNESVQAALDAQQEKAVQNYTDPGTSEPAIAARAAIIAQHGERNGLPDEFTQDQIAKATSETRLEILKQFVDNGQDLAANAYLDKYRAQFQVKELTQAEALTKHASVEGEAQRTGDQITKTATGLADALKQAAAIQEPEIRKATEQRVRQYYSDMATAERQGRAVARQQLGTILEQHGGDINAINRTSAWVLNLNDADRTALEHRANQIRNPVERSNQALAAHWRQMSALPQTQAQFLAEDFTAPKYMQQLSESDRNWLISRQIALRGKTSPTGGPVDKSVLRKQEALVVKQSKAAAQQRAGAAMMEKAAPGSSKYLPPAPTITVPKWMSDSAAHYPEYRDYLKAAGVILPDDSGSSGDVDLNKPPAPRVPGAPIVRKP